MRADLVIETPIKFFIILVVAVLLISLVKQLYAQASQGISDLVPEHEQGEYELIDVGTASASQLASLAESCYELGGRMTATQKEYGCYIVKGNFANVNTDQIRALSSHVSDLTIPSGANALFITYDFITKTVRIRP